MSGTAQPEKKQDDNVYNLASAPTPPPSQSSTSPADFNKTTVVMQESKKPESEAELMFEIRYEGQTVSVTKNKLFDLAKRGRVQPDDLIVVAGTKVFADSIHGISFGNKPSAAPPPPQPISESTVSLNYRSSKSDPFDVEGEPVVRVERPDPRTKSVFSGIQETVDSSFGKLYTPEKRDSVLQWIKPVGYVLGVICILGGIWFFVFGRQKSPPGIFYIEGTVTLDGEPIRGVNVTLNPRDESGALAGGLTDKRGRFTVTTGAAPVGTGAKEGVYDITFSKFEMEGSNLSALEYAQQFKNKQPAKIYVVPQKYENPNLSNLAPIRIEAKGKSKFRFELQTTSTPAVMDTSPTPPPTSVEETSPTSPVTGQ
jgi:hypothetical protein